MSQWFGYKVANFCQKWTKPMHILKFDNSYDMLFFDP